MRRHGFRCDCPFDRFLALLGLAAFVTVALAGFIQLYSGLLSW